MQPVRFRKSDDFSRLITVTVTVKPCAKWPILPELILGFRSMKRLGGFLLLPGWDASPSQGYPPALFRQ